MSKLYDEKSIESLSEIIVLELASFVALFKKAYNSFSSISKVYLYPLPSYRIMISFVLLKLTMVLSSIFL